MIEKRASVSLNMDNINLPTAIDLRSKMPRVYDQEKLGSCTANAICAAFEYIVPNFIGSRLFLYYNERQLKNTVLYDAGAYLCDGIKAICTYGICSETQWPYTISKFSIKPPRQCYIDALKYYVVSANNIHKDIKSMKKSLNLGFPFLVEISVYSSFESNQFVRTGIIPMPTRTDKFLGRHAVLVCGYNDSTQCWTVRNSRGSNWGDKGYFYLRYQYLLDSSLCSDLWNISVRCIKA